MSDVVDALENMRELFEGDGDIDLDDVRVALNDALIAAGQDPLSDEASGVEDVVSAEIISDEARDRHLVARAIHKTMVSMMALSNPPAIRDSKKFKDVYHAIKDSISNELQAEDDALTVHAEFMLDVWQGRFTYTDDDEWLDEFDGAIRDVSAIMGRVYTSPIFGMRPVRGDGQ